MKASKRILVVSDTAYNPVKMTLDQTGKFSKGFCLLGHHVSVFSYSMVLQSLSPFKSKTLTVRLYKSRTDEVLTRYLVNYQPDVVLIFFPRGLDHTSVMKMKESWPHAVYVGHDVDAWPALQKSPRIKTATALDILTATNDGRYLDEYRQAGVKNCVFLPNVCDPDIEKRYEVGEEWKTNILWTGKVSHKANSDDNTREEIVQRLMKRKDVSLYGCQKKSQIGGLNYLYAISGAKIGISVNAVNDVSLYHSDRLTHYLACGTCVLAKRVPDTDKLFEDGKHLRYFDSVEECFELIEWYLAHEQERRMLADAGMERVHEEFSCRKISQYVLDIAETGGYTATWTKPGS